MKPKRNRKPLPPSGEPPWLLLVEAAVQIGCSPATIHRRWRGEIDGVARMPVVQIGKRKWIVLKESLGWWQREATDVELPRGTDATRL
jgi:hypothetical protein